MGAVVNLAERRKVKPVKPTVLELATFVCDDILDHWNKAASKNMLNEYFMTCTPPYSYAHVNYLEDLTAIGEMERRIGLWCQVISPHFGNPELPGWIAAFRVGSTTITTPFFTSEAFARCFNILLFLRVNRDIKTYDI